ncbi:MAG: M23 family metallopeptidase, partial [Anaerolineaceae bacterium]
MKRFIVLLPLVLLILAGCQSILGEISAPSPAGQAQAEVIIVQASEPPAGLEAVSPEQNPDSLPTVAPFTEPAAPAQDSSPVLGVMELTFPTPRAEPVSLWRAPLFDTPLALSRYDHFYFSRPIAADQINWPLPDYRYGGIFFGADIVHTGIDIPAKRGTTVIAAGDGKVIWAGYGLFYGKGAENDPYGLAVSVEHDFGYKGQKLYTIYAHLDRIDVLAGQTVRTGTPVGLVGMTGNTTGPHLHFEVRIQDDSFYKTRNPDLWIAPPQGSGVLAGDFQSTNGAFLDQQVVNIRSLATGEKWQVVTYGPITVHKDDYYQE